MDYSYLKDWKKKAFERSGGRGKSLAFMFDIPSNKHDISFDLHIHDTNSDGERQPAKVFADASENHLDVISITNHDTIRSEEEYASFAFSTGKYNGGFINGVEVTCRLNNLPVEILVYDYNVNKAKRLISNGEFPFLDRSFRVKRILTLIQERILIANSLGLTDKKLSVDDFVSVEVPSDVGEAKVIPFSKLGLCVKDDLWNEKREVRDNVTINGETFKINLDYFNSKLFKYLVQSEKGREFLRKMNVDVPDFAGTLADVQSQSMPDALKELFSDFNRGVIQAPGSPFYLDDSEWWPTGKEVIDFAKNVNGVAILAHPYGYGSSLKNVTPEELMQIALDSGIDGVECLHGFNTGKQVESVYGFARKNNLLISAGSDTHGYYSYQGNHTDIGFAPGAGDYRNDGTNPISETRITLSNVHYIGSGEYKKDFAKPNSGEREF